MTDGLSPPIDGEAIENYAWSADQRLNRHEKRNDVTRRRLFHLAAMSLAGLSISTVWPDRARADRLFEVLFGDARLAARLGARHLVQDPASGRRGRLLVAELASGGDLDERQALAARIADQLARLETVVVDGWVMARAEADLCAAVHLDRHGS